VNARFCQLIFREWAKGKCLVSFLSEEPPYWVRLWNVETGEELLPAMLGATPKPAGGHSPSQVVELTTSAPEPPPPQTVEVVTEDLLMLDDSPEEQQPAQPDLGRAPGYKKEGKNKNRNGQQKRFKMIF